MAHGPLFRQPTVITRFWFVLKIDRKVKLVLSSGRHENDGAMVNAEIQSFSAVRLLSVRGQSTVGELTVIIQRITEIESGLKRLSVPILN